MKTTLAKVASALSFAHLAGIGRGKAKAEEDDDDKKERDHEDGNVKKGKASDDEKKDDDNRDSEYAEDDDPDAKAESDDEDPKDDDKDKEKSKAKRAEDKDDDEKMAAGAKKERARCATIFASPAAAGNVALAAELAFATDLTSAQAIAVLEKAPSARSAGNPQRAARNASLGAGGGDAPNSQQAVAAGWDRAFQSVSPRRR